LHACRLTSTELSGVYHLRWYFSHDVDETMTETPLSDSLGNRVTTQWDTYNPLMNDRHNRTRHRDERDAPATSRQSPRKLPKLRRLRHEALQIASSPHLMWSLFAGLRLGADARCQTSVSLHAETRQVTRRLWPAVGSARWDV
jgi:hypothetical protein